jgi:hypothetical protein
MVRTAVTAILPVCQLCVPGARGGLGDRGVSRRHQCRGALRQHLGGELGSEPGGVGARAGQRAAHALHGAFARICRGHDPGHGQYLLVLRAHLRVAADRGGAARLQRGQQRPLGDHGGPGGPVVERGERLAQRGVVLAALDRERALARRGQELRRVEEVGGLADPAEPAQARVGQQHAVQPPGGDVADPGVDVAADRDHLEVRTQQPQLGRAAKGARADAGAGGQIGQLVAVPGHQHVAHVLALRHRGQHQVLGRAVGRSLSECTAKSTSPRSSASRRLLTNTPVPPICAISSFVACEVSP